MMLKTILLVAVLALLAQFALGEASVVATLKAKVESGAAPAPCNNAAAAAPAAPAAPKQYLDQRLPVVVDDYHPPVGGFNPSHIPSKEVDVAARSILREIQAHEQELRENGDLPAGPQTTDGVLSAEEHKALKQLLLDSDILVRAAAKALAENGPIEAAAARKVAISAVSKASGLEKAASSPIQKLAAAAAAAPAAAAAAADATPAIPIVGAVAVATTNKNAASTVSSLAAKRK